MFSVLLHASQSRSIQFSEVQRVLSQDKRARCGSSTEMQPWVELEQSVGCSPLTC